jgi:hypothetical protein
MKKRLFAKITTHIVVIFLNIVRFLYIIPYCFMGFRIFFIQFCKLYGYLNIVTVDNLMFFGVFVV